MNIHSVKTEIAVIFLFILLFCTVHFSTVYVLAGRMSKKYARVDAAGGLRKRAVEVAGILNLHVMNGDETLGAVFDTRRAGSKSGTRP